MSRCIMEDKLCDCVGLLLCNSVYIIDILLIRVVHIYYDTCRKYLSVSSLCTFQGAYFATYSPSKLATC